MTATQTTFPYNTKRSSSLILIILLVFIYLSGCGKNEAPYPEPAVQNFDGAYTSRSDSIMIGSDKYAIDYGTLTVAESRGKTDTRYIHLPVKRIRSSSAAPLEPVFYLAGGPGRSNMANIGGMWYLMPEHDVVLVGFRGVDGSPTLDCPLVTKAMKGDGELLSKKSIAALGNAWAADAKRLQAEGADLNGYTMLDVIEDFELARQALRYEKINLKSASYGTRVSYLYGLVHPESIHCSAMVAVNPPGRFVWEPDVIDQQLHYFSDLWARDSVMSAKCPNLYAVMERVLNNMPKRWLFFPINKGKVQVVAYSLLYQRGTAAMVFDSFVAAGQGDYSGLAVMSMAYDFVMPNMMNWGDLACKAVSADYDPDRDYMSEMQPPGLPLGAPMSKLLWGPLQYGAWPVKSIPQEYKQPQPSAVQTLLVSGSIDLGTPTRYATRDLLPVLSNGKQVILSECGHMDMEWTNAKGFQRILASYYRTGEPDTSLFGYLPMDFSVKWGFPFFAKISLAIAGLVLFIIILFILLIARAIRKRKNNNYRVI